MVEKFLDESAPGRYAGGTPAGRGRLAQQLERNVP